MLKLLCDVMHIFLECCKLQTDFKKNLAVCIFVDLFMGLFPAEILCLFICLALLSCSTS